jgi:pyrroline-5-carboxylate reductase
MDDYQSLGFVGLGSMGVPMVENLIKKTSEITKVYVYDVVDDPVRQLCSQYPGRVEQGKNARNVAEKAVCKRPNLVAGVKCTCLCLLGYYNLHGS